MNTITLQYEANNSVAKETINFIKKLGVFKIAKTQKKTGLEMALEDIRKGRVTTIHTPENWKK